ncbi:hypothetical protein [Streptosporangium sp. CA-115845]|uniref:hypothetical protein n=1 Tax=Streptosporangium sp. CA-115845 TaxID=3240071 RepID=UPI003D94CCA4
MDHQSVVCVKCTGVLLATDSRTYTAQRGRLILTNGYCSCPAAQAPAEPVTEQQPQPAHTPQQNAQPAGQNSMVVA